MPGFGDMPFGHEPFGEWKWSRRVLFELIPEIYRSEDEAADGGQVKARSANARETNQT